MQLAALRKCCCVYGDHVRPQHRSGQTCRQHLSCLGPEHQTRFDGLAPWASAASSSSGIWPHLTPGAGSSSGWVAPMLDVVHGSVQLWTLMLKRTVWRFDLDVAGCTAVNRGHRHLHKAGRPSKTRLVPHTSGAHAGT